MELFIPNMLLSLFFDKDGLRHDLDGLRHSLGFISAVIKFGIYV